MTGKRYKSVGANLECSNSREYMLVKRDDGFNVCQVCSKYTAKEIVNELNNLAEENEQLRKDLIDHSALILMLEDYQALKIEDTLYNLTGAESEEEFNELYKPYLNKAKKCWKGDVE